MSTLYLCMCSFLRLLEKSNIKKIEKCSFCEKGVFFEKPCTLFYKQGGTQKREKGISNHVKCRNDMCVHT